MANFRPQFRVEKHSGNTHMFSYIGSYEKTPKVRDILTYKEFEYHASKTFVFPTYRELRKHMPIIMKEYGVDEVSVTRSRRGEWGEWFENWELAGDNLINIGEGWM